LDFFVVSDKLSLCRAPTKRNFQAVDPGKPDVIIVGAGPVGLFSVFTCGMMGLRAHVIDALDHIGGQCTALYPEKPIYDIPGFPAVTAQDLIGQLKAQIQPFQPTFHLGQKVTSLTRVEERWRLETSSGQSLSAPAIILAAGAGAFGPNRPPLEGIETFEGKSLFYTVTSKEKLRGKRVVIAGGGDSAVDWALSLQGIVSHVFFVHRRRHFRAAPESLQQLQALADAQAVDMVVPYQLSGLEGTEAGLLKAVWVKDMEEQERRLEADVLLAFFGLSHDLGPLASWGLEVENRHLVISPHTAATNLEGIYAVGDIATYPHKRKLILTGFAEAAQAAQAIRRHLRPEEVFHLEHSTTRGVPRLEA
jgi:thioredoxin reductase (NADPH)